MEDIKLIQLMDNSNYVAGLYHNTKGIDNAQDIFDVTFQEAIELEDEDGDFDVQTYVDEKLDEVYGIKRVFVDIVTSDVI